MPCHVFTYGSLMFAPVWQRVVRGQYRAQPARLAGFARFAIAGETYPGMVAQAGAAVDGVLYRDVDERDLAGLDAFEGEDYRRITVRVAPDAAATLEAQTYLYLLPQKLTPSPWQADAFQMERFIGSYCRDRLGG
ncbi:gamma-glutamylcyclotransferase family protein [Noviherbaspirillum autotrophicum]|uniref:Putative gamma-glutamylcyclotransferase n=1 Tax=Noviherbaspirillum autotrophicum TaxID=709839 RepID=A0A0C2BJE3_9BURK|nr:gamma-glutamylcyclotransferase family protein [Noviherbaspirillum autotrophicum]KIF80124.1 gamma-glutamyl cyclotransferase [Noviherbaspirillum autotrophicum]